MSSAAGVALSSLSRSNPPTRPSTPCQEPQHYRTPFERTSEQLNSQEKHTWGFTALQISLKPPPSARLALGPARRVPESSTAATSANLSRAKRPKAIKFRCVHLPAACLHHWRRWPLSLPFKNILLIIFFCDPLKHSPAKASKRSARVQSNPGLSRLAAASDAHIVRPSSF